MTSPGFLDFFVLEASEYIEQIDGLMSKGGGGGPEPEALVRYARALRGSATMARLTPFADLASALERVGRGLREGTVAWNPALRGALTSAVDDFKTLLRAARNWTPADGERAAARTAELVRLAPSTAPSQASTPTAPGSGGGGGFFVTESSNIAAGLELLVTRPNDRDAAVNVLRRVRALRGVAGIKEVPPLADIMEAAESVAKPLELGEGPLDAERMQLLRSAATFLRRVVVALREGKNIADEPTPERDAFVAAFERFQEKEAAEEEEKPGGPVTTGRRRIVPIGELFFSDEGPTVVSSAAHPPTTPAERFRLEVVSQGEHLRRLVSEAREASDSMSRDRARRALRMALESLHNDAESFGEREVAALVATHLDAARTLDPAGLSALDALASSLARPAAEGERLASRLAQVKAAPTQPSAIPSASAAMPSSGTMPPPLRRASGPVSSTAPTPIVTPAIRADASPPRPNPTQPQPAAAARPVAPPPREAELPAAEPERTPTSPPPPPMPVMPHANASSLTPGGSPRVSTPRDTMAVLDQGIQNLSHLAMQPMSDPTPLPDQPVVPIDALLYRGRAAIARAIELREEIRRVGAAPGAETLDELFDLLDLALAD
jgi:chemotaxis protein histidine kinase CheA